MTTKNRVKKKPLESVKNFDNRLGTSFPIQPYNIKSNDSQINIFSSHTLVRRDLLSYEHILCNDFANFIKFEGHALYFPTQDELQSIKYIPNEKKLLIPLRRDNALLAIFLLRNVSLAKNLLPFIEKLTSICLEKIFLLKSTRIDERCQLLRLPYFMDRVYKEVSAIKKYYAQSIAQSYAQSASGINALPNASPLEDSFENNEHLPNNSFQETFQDKFSITTYDASWNTPPTERQTSLGIMVLPILGLSYIRKYYGYNVAHRTLIKIAHEIKQQVSEDVLCTLLDNDTLAVFCAGATKRLMDKLAMKYAQIEVTMHAMPLPTMFASLENLMGDAMLFSDIFEESTRHNTEETNQAKTSRQAKNRQEENRQGENRQGENNRQIEEHTQGVRISAKLCAAYSLFPQDWDGTMHSQDQTEIPHILLNKALIAAKRLTSTPPKKGVSMEQAEFHIAGQYLGYKQILSQSGSILEILPYSQVRINLGSQDGALENMCFSVWADLKRTQYKGEILLRQVGENDALAEVLMLSDPARSMEEGDFLTYAPQSQSQSISLEEGEVFYAYQNLIDAVNTHVSANNIKSFSLSLIRIQWDKLAQKMEKSLEEKLLQKHEPLQKNTSLKKNKENNKKQNRDSTSFNMQDVARQIYRYIHAYNQKNSIYLAENVLSNQETNDLSFDINVKIERDADLYTMQNFIDTPHKENSLHPLIGSMSYNSVLVYQPAMDAENALVLYEKLAQMIEKKFGVPCAIGIAVYPYLSLRPADMWDSCRKALDYAMLLPDPHVGLFDSLAINISADRKFSQGDTFGAVEEYRMALLADGNNILAWNSLGVCLAELGRHTEARNAFEVAYARNNKDAATCYNLGSANLSLGDTERAKEYFLACLSQDKKHLYARIRLGEIAEKEELLLFNKQNTDAQFHETQSDDDIKESHLNKKKNSKKTYNKNDDKNDDAEQISPYSQAFEQYSLAAKANPDSSVPLRGLARLAMKNNEKEKARELLQLALQKNSDDAVSLQLLASLYLDGKEDAHLAEMLARQSVALLPWRRSAWNELARALEAQEKFAQAAQVRRNSMRL